MDGTAITYQVGSNVSAECLLDLYLSVGWTAYTAPEQRSSLPRAIGNSSFVVAAWSGATLVGLARCLSDDVSIVYLQDVLVRPAYQRQGIGASLVAACLDRYSHVRMAVLLADEEARLCSFYQALGFRNTGDRALNAFIRARDVSQS